MDHSATTQLSQRALDAMMPYFRDSYGNASAVYSYGQEAKNAVEKCRNRCAKCIGALPTEIYFTSGGTESDNWAIRGACELKKDKGRHIISTEIEHNAVRRTLEAMEAQGYAVTYLRPDAMGHISPRDLEAAIRPDTILISIMTANNVVGTVLDIEALAAIARKYRILFHTDAVQAAGHIPINARKMGVDILSVSAHKFNGPKGVGLLFCRLPTRLKPLLYGGGQEKEERSGTENVPGIVGMTEALEESVNALDANAAYLNALSRKLISGMLKIEGVHLTGDPVRRLPGFCSFLIEGIAHSVMLVNKMNEKGICVSSGSACSASSKEASHVITALGYDARMGQCSLRVTLGMDNTEEDVEYCLRAAKESINALRTEQKKKAPRLEGRVNAIGGAEPET